MFKFRELMQWQHNKKKTTIVNPVTNIIRGKSASQLVVRKGSTGHLHCRDEALDLLPTLTASWSYVQSDKI